VDLAYQLTSIQFSLDVFIVVITGDPIRPSPTLSKKFPSVTNSAAQILQREKKRGLLENSLAGG